MSGMAVRAGNRGGRATQLSLIQCAERLFAERGIDAVSVSEILETAGQRNKNAIHYHFGGKDGLVTAIAEHRSSALNERRDTMLVELRRRGLEHEIRELSSTLVVPLAELLDAEGCHFLGFLARYHLDRSRRQLVSSVDPRVTRTYREAYRLLAEASALTSSAMEIRFEIAMDMIFASLASRQAEESSTRGPARASRAAFVDNLVAAVSGCFSTP
jgi:AcrR family transcriptional regulator